MLTVGCLIVLPLVEINYCETAKRWQRENIFPSGASVNAWDRDSGVEDYPSGILGSAWHHYYRVPEGHSTGLINEETRGSLMDPGTFKRDSMYRHLPDRHIRLLVLEPESRERGSGETIVVKLRSVGLYSANLDYEALSYTWGRPDPKKWIRCDGEMIEVRANLYEALRYLRHSHERRTLWIDALCIDQEDKVEQGRQVQMMEDIFYSARKVIVWLGEETPDIKGVFETISSIYESTLSHHGILPSDLYQYGVWESEGLNFAARKRNEPVRKMDAKRWKIVDRLLQRPWFRRVWVMQEVGHAYKVELMCGRTTLEWAAFSEFIRSIRYDGTAAHAFSKKAEIASQNVVEMQRARTKYRRNRRFSEGYRVKRLFQLLLSTNLSECSRKRDKIYGIAGLAADVHKSDIYGFLGPDYETSTVADVFKRFAIWNIWRNGTLECLSCVGDPAQRGTPPYGLPSWAPDWTKRLPNEHPFVRYNDRIPFQAHGGDLPEISWLSKKHSQHETISFMAKPVDVVVELSGQSTFQRSYHDEGPEPRASQKAASKSRKWISQCLHFRKKSRFVGSAHPFSMTDSWEIMTCGLDSEGYRAPVSFARDFDKYLAYLDHITARFNRGQMTAQTKKFLRKHGNSIARIEDSLYMWTSRRRLACTKGNRLCWLPPFSRKGDVICIVSGCKVPYVFRPQGDGLYTVVGEAYVDGVMYGEESLSMASELRKFRLV